VLQAQNFFRGRFEPSQQVLFLSPPLNTQSAAQNPRHLLECVAAFGLVGLALVLGGREDGVGPWLGQLTFLAFAAYRSCLSAAGICRVCQYSCRPRRLALIAPDFGELELQFA